MLKSLHDWKNDKDKNKQSVDVINSGLSDLKNEIKKVFEDEIKIENSNEIVNIVEKILKFNRQQRG